MRDRVEKDGDEIVVTLKLSSPWEVRRLSTILLAVAARRSTGRAEAAQWRRIGNKLAEFSKAERNRNYTYSGRVRRPSSEHSSSVDMDFVVNGEAPYPVLSVRDMRTVWPLLEAKKLSAREVGERLYLSPRTVVRYRALARKKQERESGRGKAQSDPAQQR